jgi:hypothetical protein
MASVNYRTREEITDLFPAATTPAERLVGLEIAQFARESTRIALMPNALLRARTGLSQEGLKKALQRLSGRGLEFRIVHGYGKDGRAVYTKPGTEMEYRVPSITEFLAIHGLLDGGTTVPASMNGKPVDKPP